ncbi:MAG: adenylate/guanylate cyclase domain-containing protein [Pseudomonadota bacterium]
MRLIPAKWSKTLAKYGIRWAIGLVLTVACTVYSLGVYPIDAISRIDSFLASQRMRLEKPVMDPRVVIVDIDGKALTEVGRFPWSRNIQARLIDQLTDHYHVSAVGYDISFPEPDTSSGFGVLEGLSRTELKDVPELKGRLEALRPAMDYDGLFANALVGKPVILGFNLSTDQRKGVLPRPLITPQDLNGRELLAYSAEGYEANIAKLARVAAGSGSFSVVTDPDGIVRTAGLIQQIGDNYYPSLSLATAAIHLKALAIKPLLEGTVDTLSQNQLESGGFDYLSILLPAHKQIRIPVGEAMTTVVQFRGKGGPLGGAFRYISAADVLSGSAPPELLKDTVVLIGTTAPGLVDLRATPVNPEYPGVEIHANIIKSILDNRFKSRPFYAFFIEALAALVVGLLLTFALALLSPLMSIVLVGVTAAGTAGLNYYMYSVQDFLFNFAVLALLMAALFVFNLAWGYFFEVRKGRALVSRFGEYVAPELVAEMAEDPDKYNMDGESRELTVMFVDVRGFTTISEGLSPKALREYINLYLTAMSEDIRSAYRGTLDKYIGDAVMAFWGAPVAFEDHASRGVATSLLMQASAHRLNDDFLARGWPALKIGIGLNTGMMHVGDMGSAIRKAYTVMGDAVNLGSRLEGITKVYSVGICVGESTRKAAPDYVYRELDLVRVKGKNEPVAIFEPLGLPAAVSDAAKAEVAVWEETLALVRSQQWDAASAKLGQLKAMNPSFGLYDLYLERIAFYRAHPPGDNWDGVTTFETK